MIVMGRKKDQGGAVAMIMKKLGNRESSDYESLKAENSEMKQVPNENGAESDYKDGIEAEANKIMEAFKSSNVSDLKNALKSFIKMAMREE